MLYLLGGLFIRSGALIIIFILIDIPIILVDIPTNSGINVLTTISII